MLNKSGIVGTLVLLLILGEATSFKIRKQANVFTFLTLIQLTIGILSQSNKMGERNKRDSNREIRSQIVRIFRLYHLIPERP
jgi:hypothetical protein